MHSSDMSHNVLSVNHLGILEPSALAHAGSSKILNKSVCALLMHAVTTFRLSFFTARPTSLSNTALPSLVEKVTTLESIFVNARSSGFDLNNVTT